MAVAASVLVWRLLVEMPAYTLSYYVRVLCARVTPVANTSDGLSTSATPDIVLLLLRSSCAY